MADLIIPQGKEETKAGTVLTECESQQADLKSAERSQAELLEGIDKKLDLLLAAQQTETE